MPRNERTCRGGKIRALHVTVVVLFVSALAATALVVSVDRGPKPSEQHVQLPRDFGGRFARHPANDGATENSKSTGVFPAPDASAPIKREAFFREQRLDQTGRIAPGSITRAMRQRKKMLVDTNAVAGAGVDSSSWTWMGPGNIGGRVLAIVIHPVRTDEMLLGAASGGIWKTTDGGASWRPINDFLGSLSVSTLAIDPQNPEVVYAGTGETFTSFQGAGVYKSTNFGDNWTVLTQTVDGGPSGPWNFTNRLAVDPTDSNVILAATKFGGIFRSTDGGSLWTNELNYAWIGDIDFHPTDGTQAVAGDCCNVSGPGNQANVFYYDTAAIGGPRWQRATFTGTLGSTTLTSVEDCVPGSGNNDQMIVASTTVFRKNDLILVGAITKARIREVVNGTTLCLNASIPPTTPADTTVSILPEGRVELAYARSSPNIVYMSLPAAGGSLWKSTDGGQSYAPVASRLGHMWGQGAYNNAIWVDPTDANHVMLGGGDLIITEDGGTTFRKGAPPEQGGHADRHWFVEHPDFDGTTNRTVFVGSDGGIYKAPNVRQMGRGRGIRLESLNHNLGITQFIHLDVDTATGRMLGGTQDNGALRFVPPSGSNEWESYMGGDAGFSWIDPADPAFTFSEYTSARVIRNRNYFHAAITDRNGNCCTSAGSDSNANCIAVADPPPAGSLTDACKGKGIFYAPTLLDPGNSRRFLVGAEQLWLTEDAHADPIVWSVIKGRTGLCNTGSTNPGATCTDDTDCISGPGGAGGVCKIAWISTIDVSPTNSDIIWVGHTDGTVFRTSNGTAAVPSWVRVDNNAPAIPDLFAGPLPRRYCTRVRIDPSNANRVYVAIGGYKGNTLFETDDAGASWQLISGSLNCDATRPVTALPCIQVNTVQVHPSQPGWLYVGTDLGLYTSENDGLTWSASNDGPANVIVYDLTWNDNEQLYAVTHGRGIFRTAPIVPDCDSNGVDDRTELALRDCNGNLRIDSCDIASGESPDCNTNLLPDECEISVSSPAPGGPYFCVLDCRPDCDDNGVPDECDADCNGNGQPDACDLQSALTFVRTTQHIAGLAPHSIASADFDRNGFGDLAVANWESFDISVLINRGSSATGDWLGYQDAVNYRTREVNAIPWALTTGDFDQDGDDDIAYVSESGDILRLECDLGVMLNNGDGTFSWPGFTPIHIEGIGPFRCEDIVAGDLDGDHFLDLVVANTASAGGIGANNVTIIHNGGLNTSGAWRGFLRPLGLDAFPNVGVKPIDVALGRFNTDGFLDIATANENSGDVSILLNDGTGVFGLATTISLGTAPTSLGASDLNGNGYDDLVVGRRTSGLLHYLQSNGDGTFTTLPALQTDLGGVDAITLADLDREHSIDITAVLDTGVAPSILLNNSVGGFGLPFRASSVAPTVSITTVDVDNDGDLDLAKVGGSTTSRVIVLRNDTDIDCNRNGVPDNCEIASGRPDSDASGLLDECEVGACDADGDGDCDLADYRRIHNCWRGPDIPCGTTAGSGLAPRDFDRDFDFDMRDFAILQNSFSESRDCCDTHGPGCHDYDTETCVCDALPECCAIAWDETCVAAIAALGCGVCAPPTLCGDGICEGDEDCTTCAYDCGLCPGSCCEAHDSPGCEDPGVQACVCLSMPECCTGVWSEACVAEAGDTCHSCCGDGVCGLGEGCEACPADCTDCPPGCGNTFCEVGEDCTSCPMDCGTCPIVCGDGICNGDETCVTCVADCGTCGGSCCLGNGTIGCLDPAVTVCVCSFDSDCCTVGWTTQCAQGAIQCGACNNDCCVPGNSPGCIDLSITACVCAGDSFCCDGAWDGACVNLVDALGCGSCVTNNAPTVAITAPPQDTSTSDVNFIYDGFDTQLGLWYKDVSLKGEASDLEDGVLSGASLVWTTDRTDLQPSGTGFLGTGTFATVRLYSNVAAPGGVWHTITLTATDSQGSSTTAVRRIYIWGFG